jgi:hypothetical protein
VGARPERPGIAGRPGGGDRPGIGHRPGGPAHRPGRSQIANDVRRHWRERYPGHGRFDRGWWNRHRAAIGYYPRWHPWRRWRYRPGYWWGWCTAGALTGWFAYDWGTPLYYTYGTGGYVYYDNDMVYVNNQPYCSAAEYYDQADSLATAVPDLSEQQAENIEWLPLGVFAITQDGVDDSSILLQLAVSKDGIISGTYYNETTDTTRPIQGTVDKKTQRAAWTFADGKDTGWVMETSIYNLTKDECSALVHFGPEQTQTWGMVRLEQPEKTAEETK